MKSRHTSGIWYNVLEFAFMMWNALCFMASALMALAMFEGTTLAGPSLTQTIIVWACGAIVISIPMGFRYVLKIIDILEAGSGSEDC